MGYLMGSCLMLVVFLLGEPRCDAAAPDCGLLLIAVHPQQLMYLTDAAVDNLCSHLLLLLTRNNLRCVL